MSLKSRFKTINLTIRANDSDVFLPDVHLQEPGLYYSLDPPLDKVGGMSDELIG